MKELNIKLVLVAVVTLLCHVSANAEIVKIGELWYDIVKKINKVEVISRQDPDFDEVWMIPINYVGDIVVPDSVEYHGEYLKVTSIGVGAFSDCYYASKVTVPKTVKIIDSYAFATIVRPDGTFWGTNPEIVIHSEVLETIGDYAFNGCKNLRSITMPNSVKSIGDYAFSHSGLYSIEIPNSVDAIAVGCFEGCEDLNSIKLPDNLRNIGDNAFGDCSNLAELKLPNSLQSIGHNAFSGCSKLTGLKFPDNLQNIEDYAFDGCTGLIALDFQKQLQSIGDYAFKECTELTSIKLPDSLLELGNGAFYGCTSIESVFIPKNTISIGRAAFGYCSDMCSIIVEDGNINYDSRNSCNAIIETATNVLLAGSKNTKIPNSVKIIGENAFLGCEGLNSIIISNGITKIGNSAFRDCCNLTNITIPDSVKNIEDFAFYGCTRLANITISKGIKEIGNYAFANCEDLQNVFCNAKSVPQTAVNIFNNSYIEYATLYVHHSLLIDYKSTTPWMDFGSIAVNKNLTLTFNLIYMLGEEEYRKYEIEEGDSIIIPEDPTKEGYTFNGWNEAPEIMPACDVTISGAFTVNKYLVTFKIGDEVIMADSLEFGVAIVAPEAPAKEGHTFAGWGEVAKTVPASNVTYEGTYTVNNYTVTFKIGDEVIFSESMAYGTAIVAPEAPAKEGHTFAGWGEVAETVPASNVAFEGSYSVNTYKVYYYVGEELVHTEEVVYGEAIPEYIYEPKEDCTFLGWIGDTYETMPAHDVTYTANIESGIEELTKYNGQLTIYDFTGRKVTDTEKLKSGIYIINRRKLVIH